MSRVLSVPIVVCLAAGLLVIASAGSALASPNYGGSCQYCHGGDAPDAMDITGESSTEDDVKVFTVQPGGEVDFGFNVTDPGSPAYYRVVLRGLDGLNGVEEDGSLAYLPRIYTPDPTWLSEGNGQQYLYRDGQFYGTDAVDATGPASGPVAFNYHLIVGEDVEPGVYDLTAYVAGGALTRTLGERPSGGWSYDQDFQLRVAIPEPGSVVLMVLGICGLGAFAWRRRQRTT